MSPIKNSLKPSKPSKTSKSTPAQLEAAARYRLKNRTQLQGKARERMAQYRKQLKNNPQGLEEYQTRAREADARYRERHGERVYCRQADKRATAFVAKYGADAWLKRNRNSMRRESVERRRREDDRGGEEGSGGEEGDEEGMDGDEEGTDGE
ncbi:hypothetical protein R3P38DRAFT_3222009 [Favolaschia claudopus]|uniref:Uncharacterized protein n=1 Tax=Favolaschia claudopus TaxID=2862362 RepID=A0AAV9ZZF4_9AGAR